jgi:peptidoglycan/LPS O-acetylase OafA/YrhL
MLGFWLSMGVMRLALSLLVVGSHVGGMGDRPAGTTAIAGFFTISGFLMARTILENYSDGARRADGFLRFYANRAIRIGPPFIAALAVTWVALWMRDARPFQNHLEGGVPTGAYMPVDLPRSPLGVFSLEWRGFPLFVYPSVALLPQTWSLVTETAFYVAAPFLFLSFTATRTRSWRWIVPLASLCLALAGHHSNWLRSALAAVWVFWLGMQVYFLTRMRQRAQSPATRHAALVPGVLVVLIGCGITRTSDDLAAFVVPLLVALWLFLGGWNSRASGAWDRRLGNLSYGVFLGHFLGTVAMYWIAEYVYTRTGLFGVFGIPDVTEQRLRVSAFVFALIFGCLIYLLFERPFEKLRTRLRRRRRNVPVVATTVEPALETQTLVSSS